MADVDAVVIGAGVVGLAIARTLAVSGLSVIILERNDAFGQETSARNSEVVHAGIYYPQGSLKAELCVRGKALLYAYCDRMHVPYKRLGKIIFAADASQVEILDSIRCAAKAAGVDDLSPLSPGDVRAREPDLECAAALFSPSTGIVDSHAYMTALLGEAEGHGAQLVCRSPVDRFARVGPNWGLYLTGAPQPDLTCRYLVNAAGLSAHDVTARSTAETGIVAPAVRFARGVYYGYQGRAPFRHLIYPVPVPGGLGTHLTLDMSGGARFGPNVEWIDSIDYSISPTTREHFVAAAQAIWPGMDPSRLVPSYAGIRAKLSGPGEPPVDFRIDDERDHGQSGLVLLYGIESPGLTSSLAIAGQVAARLGVDKISIQ